MELMENMIKGKWNKGKYYIEGLLGQGGMAKVYRAIDIEEKKTYALKVSQDIQSITKEAEMLSTLSDMECLPYIIDFDDFDYDNKTYYFIAMEYIEGYNLKELIDKKRINIKEAIGVVIIIGEFLKKLHGQGYIYGDLKAENIMIDKKSNSIRIIDLGGITPIGNSINEFTPLYDRAKWQSGLRRADEKYDIFSLSMLLTLMIIKNEGKLLKMTILDILNELKKNKANKGIIRIIKNGLLQKETTFNFIEELKSIYKDVPNIKQNVESLDSIVNGYLISCIICFFTILFILIK